MSFYFAVKAWELHELYSELIALNNKAGLLRNGVKGVLWVFRFIIIAGNEPKTWLNFEKFKQTKLLKLKHWWQYKEETTWRFLS